MVYGQGFRVKGSGCRVKELSLSYSNMGNYVGYRRYIGFRV